MDNSLEMIFIATQTETESVAFSVLNAPAGTSGIREAESYFSVLNNAVGVAAPKAMVVSEASTPSNAGGDRLQRRPAIVPKPSMSGVDNAQPLSAMRALTLLSTLQSAAIVLPTTDGREIRLRRITEPTAEQKSLLQQLGMNLAERFEPIPKCSVDLAIA